MNRFHISFLILIPIICFAQHEYQQQESNRRIITTSFVIQNWKIDGLDERIAEGTFPIDIIYPIRDNITAQLSHSPALSRFGATTLNGLSDTWLRGSYTFLDNKCAISCGLGLPTGKTELTTEESKLDSLLSQNVFRFRLPVFGQGITANTGIVAAHQLSDKLAIGGGLNYVYRGKYKYRKDISATLNIGDQFGFTLGVDYYHSSKIRTNVDVIYTYFLKDKIDNKEVFGAAEKMAMKFSFEYISTRGELCVVARYRFSGKNETWNNITLLTEKEPKNSNIVQREIDAIYQVPFSELFALEFLLEIRSYVENEYKKGQADIIGGGVGNKMKITPNWRLNTIFKIFFGNGYYNKSIPGFSGSEFMIGTEYIF